MRTAGVMIAMSSTITLKGSVKFSMKKLVIGGEMAHSTYTGPGELLLAPPSLGDITLLRLTGSEKIPWTVGKESYLASTQGVVKDYKAQSIAKGLFSGEGFFTYKMSGSGIVWLTSLGAIIRKDVSDCRYSPTHAVVADQTRISCKPERSTSSTTGTWWPGTATMSWSELLAVESYQRSALARDWFASSKGLAQSSCRHETLRAWQNGLAHMLICSKRSCS